tara:strand:+ start:540 stop:779 length:240 start_codon:yes stop_codon:yes gene_type:complete
MSKQQTYYAIATQQGSTVKLEIRDTIKGNIHKTYRIPGKLDTTPIISGDTVNVTVTIGAYKKLIIQNIKTGKKVVRPIK